MADTPKPGETQIPTGNPEPPVQTPAPAPAGNAGEAEVERLRKEAEQARMRANQLQNQLDAKAAAEAEAERKRLEEQQEWKTLAEQERARREALEQEQANAERTASITKATTEVLSQFNDKVVEIAQATGLSVESDDEAGIAAFKAKLDKINASVTGTGRPAPNNPNVTTGTTQEQLMARVKAGDRTARLEAISELDAVKVMRQMSGYGE